MWARGPALVTCPRSRCTDPLKLLQHKPPTLSFLGGLYRFTWFPAWLNQKEPSRTKVVDNNFDRGSYDEICVAWCSMYMINPPVLYCLPFSFHADSRWGCSRTEALLWRCSFREGKGMEGTSLEPSSTAARPETYLIDRALWVNRTMRTIHNLHPLLPGFFLFPF